MNLRKTQMHSSPFHDIQKGNTSFKKQKTTCEKCDQIVCNGTMNHTQKSFQTIVTSVILLCAILSSVSVFAADPAGFSVSDASFKAPADWKKATTNSPMRKAQFAVARKGIQDKGEVVFYHFGPGAVGGTQANVKRWLGQFKEPVEQLGTKTEKSKVDSTNVTLVKAHGTYLSGAPIGPKTPKPNYALLGAIIEAPKGHIFIKFTGPRDLVDDAEKGFRKMVQSAKISR